MFGRKGKKKVPEIMTACYSDAGNRKYQQDAVYVSPGKRLNVEGKTRVLVAVCDGMGGMTDGGLASETAIEMLKNGFEKIEAEENVDINNFFVQGIRAIDRQISSFPKEGGRGSGTTMVAAIAEDNLLHWAAVGDSRIYTLRGSVLTQVTRDHNYMLCLQEMVAKGELTQEEAQAKNQKEALISFLGIGNVSLMDINPEPYELQYGDIVLLCSDGITKTLTDQQIKKILLSKSHSIEKKAKLLVETAIKENTRTQDNTSVAILQYTE